MTGMHMCEVCFRDMTEHAEECDQGCRHFPAVCCEGCPCESYERAHAEMSWTVEHEKIAVGLRKVIVETLHPSPDENYEPELRRLVRTIMDGRAT